MTHSTALITAILIAALAPAVMAEKKPNASAPLTLSLSATIAPAPAQVTARIRVEPNPQSRRLLVEWWAAEGAGGSHEITLDGDRASARQDFAMKRIEPGDYNVRVVVLRADGSTVRKESKLIVVGEGSTFTSAGTGADLVVMPPDHGRR